MRVAQDRVATLIVSVVVAFFFAGCAQLQVKKIKPGDEDGGLAYCLLVPKLQVVTKEILVYDNLDLDKPPYSRAARPIQEAIATVVQVPSYDHYYSAKVKSGWFTADSYTIGYDANGCLNTYTFSTVDQTGTVITTLGSIALAAAALGAGESLKPEVTYPEPLEETYLIQRSSRQVLDQAEERIKNLSARVSILVAKAKASPLTDKEQTELNTVQDQLSTVNEKAAKLRDLLNPTPNRVIKTQYVDLRFIASGISADEYVISQMQEAEKNNNKNNFIPDQNGKSADDFFVGVVRRIQ